MKRRDFLILTASASAGSLLHANPALADVNKEYSKATKRAVDAKELSADVIIIGGGVGGCASALSACRNGQKVILVEETDWIGGQFSAQMVPADEHRWIRTNGAPASYREFRNRVMDFYRKNYPLKEEVKKMEFFSPGNGWVSHLCHEPRVTLAVLHEMLLSYMSSGKLTILLEYKAKRADVDGDYVKAIEIENKERTKRIVLRAPYFVDATECGDLLPMTGTEYITGSESKAQTGELHAQTKHRPNNNQAFTVCFAIDYQPGENHVIDKPKDYDFWKNFEPKMTPAWSGKMLSLTTPNPQTLEHQKGGFSPDGSYGQWNDLWSYRKIVDKNNFVEGTYLGDITSINLPQQDYLLGNILDVSEEEFNRHVAAAKQQSLSLLYWLQTEVERPDGGQGWPGIRLRNDVVGTEDGLAKYPYIREARRIKAEFTVLEEHIGAEQRLLVAGPEKGKKAAYFYDSVGTGYYPIDLHPTCEGDNYIDIPCLRYQIPLGALLPQRMNNLLPANKNTGTTHITNGAMREHPVEWSFGEAVGSLISFSLKKGVIPRAVRADRNLLSEFQDWIRKQGLETDWPEEA